jgi:hypothetical protein
LKKGGTATHTQTAAYKHVGVEVCKMGLVNNEGSKGCAWCSRWGNQRVGGQKWSKCLTSRLLAGLEHGNTTTTVVRPKSFAGSTKLCVCGGASDLLDLFLLALGSFF